MPGLDRRIVVQVAVTSVNVFGEPVHTRTDYPMWAGVADLSAFSVSEEGGQFTDRIRRWMVRWHREIFLTESTQVKVIDSGVTYGVINIVRQQDGRARRRMILIEGTSEV